MVQSPPLEKEMATHSSILAWRIPWTEELGGLQSTGHKESDTTERLQFHFHFHSPGLPYPRRRTYVDQMQVVIFPTSPFSTKDKTVR